MFLKLGHFYAIYFIFLHGENSCVTLYIRENKKEDFLTLSDANVIQIIIIQPTKSPINILNRFKFCTYSSFKRRSSTFASLLLSLILQAQVCFFLRPSVSQNFVRDIYFFLSTALKFNLILKTSVIYIHIRGYLNTQSA